MDLNGIIEVCDKLGLKYSTPRDGNETVGPQISISCPLAKLRHKDPYDHNMGCSVKIDPDGPSLVRCFSGSCGFKGTLSRMLELALDDSYADYVKSISDIEKVTIEAQLLKNAKKLKEPPLSKKLGYDDKDIIPDATWDEMTSNLPDYAIKRGITPESARRWDLRYDTRLKRLVFPIKRVDGKLVGMQGRDVTDEAERRHHNYQGFNRQKYLLGSNLLEQGKPVVIVEGTTGAVKTDQALYPKACTVAVLGDGFSQYHADTICSFNPPLVYIFMDGDSPGRTMSNKIERALHGRVFMRLMLCPSSLLPDGSKRDPGNLSADELNAIFDTAKPIVGKIVWN